jgi:hypothetical protein
MSKSKESNLNRMRLVAAVGLGLIIVIAVAVWYNQIPNTGGSSKTPIGGNGIADGTVWQTLYVTNVDGSSYWVNAPKPFSLGSIFGYSSSAAQFQKVSTMQNNIYMSISQGGITSWTFSCHETITINKNSGTYGVPGAVISTIADSAVNANGQSITPNTNTWVTGASLSATNLQTVLNQPAGTYDFVITLSNINLTITVNGQQYTFTAPSGTSQNVLVWLITVGQ